MSINNSKRFKVFLKLEHANISIWWKLAIATMYGYSFLSYTKKTDIDFAKK